MFFYLHGRPAFGSSCTEFVYSGCWHFDNGVTSKIDDVLTELGGWNILSKFQSLSFKIRLGPNDFSFSPSPLGTNLGFELGWTGLGLGLIGLRTKGLGPGLDKRKGDF